MQWLLQLLFLGITVAAALLGLRRQDSGVDRDRVRARARDQLSHRLQGGANPAVSEP